MTTIHEPQGGNRCQFAKEQNTCRKHVKQGFGVLQSLFMSNHSSSFYVLGHTYNGRHHVYVCDFTQHGYRRWS